MGYGYSYGYGYGSGSSYSYGYSSPPPPNSLSPPPSFSLSPPPQTFLAPPPCPSLSKQVSPPPPVPDSPPPVPDFPPPVPYSSPPVPDSLSPPPPVPASSPLPVPDSSPPPVPDSSPPPVPVSSPPPPVPVTSPPPPVPVASPSLAPPAQIPSPSPLKTLKPHVELYYSPPPPIQPLPPINTDPYNYISPPPPPPPLAPASPPPLPKSPPPLAPKSPPVEPPTSPPPAPKSPSPLAPKLAPVEPPISPPVSPPLSSPVEPPVSSPVYAPPVDSYTPPPPPPSPPKRMPLSPPKSPTRPGAVNPNANNNNNTSQNIVISREAAAAIVVVAGLVTLSFVGAAFWFVKQRRRPEAEEPIGHMPNFMPSPTIGSLASETSGQGSRGIFPPGLAKFSSSNYTHPYSPSETGLAMSKQWFTFSDLSLFTNGFSNQNLLGEGGFGCVYKGVLPDGRQVAVKQLRESSGQGEREFKAEVDIISRVHHRHLVSLVGYCISDDQRILVYDFVPNNTLYYHLHGNGGSVLSWSTRIKIATGAARGIAYLHEDCHPKIIHRDIKSSNILIDNNFEAQVSDFGLARLAMDTNSHVTTRVMGTFGYLAPEYALSGKLTAKSDVYSFGVVLLELITGRKPVDSSRPLGDESLVEWAKPYLMRALENREFGELPDPKLENRYDEIEMHRMIEAAAACVRHSSNMRPRMGQVVRALGSLLLSDTNLTNGIPPGQSEIFEPQTEEIQMFQMREFGDISSEISQASSRRHRGDL